MDIVAYLPMKRKQTASGWISFNAVCCIHNGENADKRGRGGVKPDGDNWTYHCFNCGYKTSFTLGRPVSFRARKLLSWLGVDNKDIELLNLESLRNKSVSDLATSVQISPSIPKFHSVELPEGAVALDSHTHKQHAEYLQHRCINPTDYPFLVTPDAKGRSALRIIIPFTHGAEVVGYTSRFIDNKSPKYISEQQTGYVFGLDLQDPQWQYMIVSEGVLDAVSISGVGVLHNKISREQATLIKQHHKQVIVVPDKDSAGITMLDSAIEHGFGASIPDWPKHCKDINDAVQSLGTTATLLSIIQSAVFSKIKIELAKKQFVKKIS